MLHSMAVSALLVIATVLVHYEALQIIANWLPRIEHLHGRARLVAVVIGVFIAHTIEVWLYAAAYYVLSGTGDFGGFGGEHRGTFRDHLYFSAVTYTSLGIGDVYPKGGMRLIGGVEALNGLVLIAWSASFTYLAMRKFWKFPANGDDSDRDR